MHIIDRRANPGGKSLANRQRLMRRAKALIRRAVRESSRERSIREVEGGAEIVIPADGVHEPTLKRGSGSGIRDAVLPGNKRYLEGDRIPRPPGGAGGGGREGSPDGEGEDEFRFVLSQEEFLDIFLEDLELPDLAKRRLAGIASPGWRRAGYAVTGSPANLSLPRTMRQSLSRRMALSRPSAAEIEAIEAELAALGTTPDDEERRIALLAELDALVARATRVPFIDPLDLRYRHSVPQPKPVAQAVMFCLMDVSGSMTEHMKDLAKRFFTLLYLFLSRRYRQVEIVFIRHTHHAEEVDEDTFFHSTETGGTVVSTALAEMARIVEARFPPSQWNIYAAQASDGDNTPADNDRTLALLTEDVLPVCQYFAYLEVGNDQPIGFVSRSSELWASYEGVAARTEHLAMRRVDHRRDIYPVFRELFRRRDTARATR